MFHKLMSRPQLLVDALNTGLLSGLDFSVSWFCRWNFSFDDLDGRSLDSRVVAVVEVMNRGRRFTSRERDKLLAVLLRGRLGRLHPLLTALETGALPLRVPLSVTARFLHSARWEGPNLPFIVMDARRLIALSVTPKFGTRVHSHCLAQLSTSIFSHLPEVRSFTNPYCAPPLVFL
jgi:hypothetical protein